MASRHNNNNSNNNNEFKNNVQYALNVDNVMTAYIINLIPICIFQLLWKWLGGIGWTAAIAQAGILTRTPLIRSSKLWPV